MTTRHERVIVDLDDRLSRQTVKMAAGVRLFARELDKADRTTVQFDRTTTDVGRNIDKLSGRLALFIDLAATLGPALIPVTAAAVPAFAGLANQLGFAAAAGGVAILAFQGVGDALKAVNEAQLNPTTENLEKMREELAKLGPAGRDFVMELQELRPLMQDLQDSAQDGLFPGMTEGIDELMNRFPEVERIIGEVADATGDMLGKAGSGLAGPEWDQFFTMLESEARPTLTALFGTVGNLARGFAELWVAFAPLNRDFSSGFLDMSRSFAEWADGLSATQGFQEFVAYVRETGPQVLDTLGDLSMALIDFGTAAAPLGGPALEALSGIANVVSAVAESDLGTPLLAGVAAMRAFSLATTAATAVSTRFNATQAGVVGGFTKQRASLAGIKSDLTGVGGAQRDLARAQAEQRRAAASYTGQLQVQNRLTSKGLGDNVAGQARVADALGRVEMANYSVAQATERANAAKATQRARMAALAGTAGKAAAGVGALAVATSGVADDMGLANTATLGLLGTMAGPYGTAIGTTVGLLLDLNAAGSTVPEIFERINRAVSTDDLSMVNTQVKALRDSMADLGSTDGVGDFFSDEFKALGAMMSGDAYFDWSSFGYKMTAEAADEAAAAQQRFRDSLPVNMPLDFAAGLGDDLMGVVTNADGARDSVLGFTQAVQLANNAMAEQGTVDAYRSALLSMRDVLRENGTDFSEFTKAGLANRTALRGLAGAALQAAQTMEGMGKTNFLDQARDDFISTAVAAGATRREARGLANDFGLVAQLRITPRVEEKGSKESAARVKKLQDRIKEIKGRIATMGEKGAAAARARIAALRSEIAALRSKSVTITTIRRTVGFAAAPGAGVAGVAAGLAAVDFDAYGGIHSGGVRVFAGGGFHDPRDRANRHMPELAGPGAVRVWREPETQGEAYIPLANDDRRPRARAILEETAALLGGVAYFADGGLSGDHRRRGAQRPRRRGDDPSPSLARFRAELEKSRAAVERERQQRDNLVEKRNTLAGTVRDKFRTDLFGGDTSPWASAGAAGDPLSVLRGDIARTEKYRSQVAALRKRGVSGDALAEIAATGDVAKLSALSSMSNGNLRAYQQLYDRRAKITASVGASVGGAAYGGEFAQATKELAAANATLRRMEAEARRRGKKQKGRDRDRDKRLAKAINGGASKATRNRVARGRRR